MRHHAFAVATGFATAVLLASASQSQAASADPTGYWMKPDAERESKIQVFKCGTGKKLLCAKIAWLKDPHDRKGQALTDVRNENPSLRNRQIVGLTIFNGLMPSAPSTWTGRIYNPEDGRIYSATLTVLSRSKILLKGCKAWLLCGERHWLRTAPPPEELKPAAPAEGTEQIEASVTPSAPPPDELATVTPAALVTEEIAEPAAPSAEYDWQRGYGFLSLPNAPSTAEQLSGENVSSMMVMAEPIATDAEAAAAGEQGDATAANQSGEPVPLPPQKPKATPKPVVATAAAGAKPAPKQSTTPKPAAQAAPAPQDGDAAQANAESGNGATARAATAEASMAEEVPLTRRQKRLLRRQQQQTEPFLPWLR